MNSDTNNEMQQIVKIQPKRGKQIKRRVLKVRVVDEYARTPLYGLFDSRVVGRAVITDIDGEFLGIDMRLVNEVSDLSKRGVRVTSKHNTTKEITGVELVRDYGRMTEIEYIIHVDNKLGMEEVVERHRDDLGYTPKVL